LVDYLVGSELNIHFDKNKPNWHKRPDWFLAVGVSPERNKLKRKSYLTWQEQVRPYLLIEILSKSTEDEDLGLTERKDGVPTKWEVYQDILKVPYYVCFDQRKSEIKAFRREKSGFVQMVIPKSGLWLKDIHLGLHILERLWIETLCPVYGLGPASLAQGKIRLVGLCTLQHDHILDTQQVLTDRFNRLSGLVRLPPGLIHGGQHKNALREILQVRRSPIGDNGSEGTRGLGKFVLVV
jgi:Uma2 family endonuclease